MLTPQPVPGKFSPPPFPPTHSRLILVHARANEYYKLVDKFFENKTSQRVFICSSGRLGIKFEECSEDPNTRMIRIPDQSRMRMLDFCQVVE
jgi:hypothetical protein